MARYYDLEDEDDYGPYRAPPGATLFMVADLRGAVGLDAWRINVDVRESGRRRLRARGGISFFASSRTEAIEKANSYIMHLKSSYGMAPNAHVVRLGMFRSSRQSVFGTRRGTLR